MWKVWKKEILVISLTVILLICAIVSVVVSRQTTPQDETNWDIQFHLMVEDTIYWYSSDSIVAELPEGYEEFAKVETEIQGRAEENGQANGYAAGTPLYRNEAQPGWIFAPDANGRWTRLAVKELRQTLLRYNGKLYIYVLSSIPNNEMDISYKFLSKDFVPTGETVSFCGSDVVPSEDGTANSRFHIGSQVSVNPEQNNMLALTRLRTQNGKTDIDYYPFITAESIGLDYSAYEWN